MLDYSLIHAVERLKEDGKLQIWGKNAYKSFKKYAKGKVLYNCRKQGSQCYHIIFERDLECDPDNELYSENSCKDCEHRECFDCPLKTDLNFMDI